MKIILRTIRMLSIRDPKSNKELVRKLPVKNYALALIMCLGFHATVSAQTSWFVSKMSGSDSNSGLNPSTPFKTVEYAVDFLQPGDTLFIMDEYRNDSYIQGYSFGGDINDPHIWLDEHTIKIIDLHGDQDNYITIKP